MPRKQPIKSKFDHQKRTKPLRGHLSEQPIATIWGPRIWALIAANGWEESTWIGHFGLGPTVLSRLIWVSRTAKPIRAQPDLVIRLRKLETVYATELAAYGWLQSELAKHNDANHNKLKLPAKWKAGNPIHSKRPGVSWQSKRSFETMEAIAGEYEVRRSNHKRRPDASDNVRLAEKRFGLETYTERQLGRPEAYERR